MENNLFTSFSSLWHRPLCHSLVQFVLWASTISCSKYDRQILHVHNFKLETLSQCETVMANGWIRQCAVWHMKINDCVCGEKATTESFLSMIKK